VVTGRVIRVLAPNPSPMTLEGTNTYVVLGGREAIVIDPGPTDEAHIDAIVACATENGASIGAIAVTHGHPDHAPGAAPLHARTGAPVYAHKVARFPFDVASGDGDRVIAGDAVLEVIDAPGHARDHLVFSLPLERALFTGDVVIGRGTVVIAPPNGDMRAYQATLARLLREHGDDKTIYGGHGPAIDAPRAKLEEYIAHRELREREIVTALGTGERTIPELVATIYRAVSTFLWPAAARQVLAYLIALEREGRVETRLLTRPMTEAEAAILDPDLSKLADSESAAVARAELGFDDRAAGIATYALI
jgi:glyoxylase-like metal-dependent hydrolase (beta-lactamase superfamily II)